MGLKLLKLKRAFKSLFSEKINKKFVCKYHLDIYLCSLLIKRNSKELIFIGPIAQLVRAPDS